MASLAHYTAEDVADAFERLAALARSGSVRIEGPGKDADDKLTASDSYTNAVKDAEIARLFLVAYRLEIDRLRPPSTIRLIQAPSMLVAGPDGKPVTQHAGVELATTYEGP